MNLVDIFIIVFLLLFAAIGFNRGVIKSLITVLGFIIVIFGAYTLKNYIGDILVLNLPFISFGDFLGGAVTLNIIMYQMLAFLIMLIIFGLIYKFLVTISGIFEKILKMTIVLGIPSKLLGMIVGALEGYIIVYLALFFLYQPFLDSSFLEVSKYAPTILNKSPVISSIAEGGLQIINEITDATKIKDKENMDLVISDLILKHKVTSPEIMQKLVDTIKINVDGIQEIIDKYQKK